MHTFFFANDAFLLEFQWAGGALNDFNATVDQDESRKLLSNQ